MAGGGGEGGGVNKDGEEGSVKKVKCPLCDYISDRKNNLTRHTRAMHQATTKLTECCGRFFNNKADLRAHNHVYHKQGYKCSVCGHTCSRKAMLRRHIAVHTGEREFSCPACDYKSSNKSNVDRHMRVHQRQGTQDTQGTQRSAQAQPTSLWPCPTALQPYAPPCILPDAPSRLPHPLSFFLPLPPGALTRVPTTPAPLQPPLALSQPGPALSQPCPALPQPCPALPQPAPALSQPAPAILQPATAAASLPGRVRRGFSVRELLSEEPETRPATQHGICSLIRGPRCYPPANLSPASPSPSSPVTACLPPLYPGPPAVQRPPWTAAPRDRTTSSDSSGYGSPEPEMDPHETEMDRQLVKKMDQRIGQVHVQGTPGQQGSGQGQQNQQGGTDYVPKKMRVSRRFQLKTAATRD